MHLPTVLLISFFFISSLHASVTTFQFNSTASCVAEGVCKWEDGGSWNASVVPMCSVGGVCVVQVASNTSVTLLIESSVSQFTVFLDSNIQLVAQGANLTLSALTWDNTSSVSIFNSNYTGATLNAAGNLNISESNVQVLYSALLVSTQISSSQTQFAASTTYGDLIIMKSNSTFANTLMWRRASLQITSSTVTFLFLGGYSTGPLVIEDSTIAMSAVLSHVVISGIAAINIMLRSTISNLTQPYGSVEFNLYDHLSISASPSSISGLFYLYNSSSLSVDSLTMTPSSADLPCVSGNGTLSFDESFVCPGDVDVVSVVTSSKASITVESLKANTIQTGFSSLYIDADVEVTNLNINGYLIIDGDYEQKDGILHMQVYTSGDEASLQVKGDVDLDNVAVTVVPSGYNFHHYSELPIVESEEKKLTYAFSKITDQSDPHRVLYSYVKDGVLWVGDKPPSWAAKNWIYIIYFSIVGVIALIVAILLARNATDNKSYLPSADPHDYFKDLYDGRTTKRSVCGWILFVIVLIICLPFIVEFVTFTIALGLLIPLGFMFGLIEHKFVFLWAMIVLLIQIGGLLDIIADVILLAKVFVIYMETEFHTKQAGDDQEQEDVFFYARVVLTMAGSAASLICCGKLFSSAVSYKKVAPKTAAATTTTTTTGTASNASGDKGTVAAKKAPAKTATTTTTKKKSSSNYTCPMSGGAAIPVLILMVSMWKVVLIGLRLYLCFVVLTGLIKQRKLVEKVQRKLQWLEGLLYMDLMFSGIPLGILTVLQLWYEREAVFDTDKMLELMKLSALGVDLVGAAFLFWFIFYGLIHKFSALSHHHDAHAHHGAHGDEHDGKHATRDDSHIGEQGGHAVVSVNIASNDTDTTPLLKQEH